MNKPKMILFDLDGTVLTWDKRVSERNRQVLWAAAEQGVHIVPATGRFLKAMPQAVLDLPFRYAITTNGAMVVDRETNTVIHSQCIDNKTTLEVFDALSQLDGIYDCYYNGWGYMQQDMYDQAEVYAKSDHALNMIRTYRTPVADIRAFVADKEVEKAQIFMGNMDEHAQQMVALAERFPLLNITTSVPGNIEINSSEAHKGLGMVKLCQHLGIDVADALAFGDDLNDLTMLELAGMGVAMGNGKPAAKEVANRIGPTNDEDGVGEISAELLGL